jgi:hypothetical protein
LVVDRPSGVVVGDVVLLVIAARGNPLFTPPVGFSFIRQDIVANNVRQSVWWKIAGGSEPASYEVVLNQAKDAAGAVLAYRGVDVADPIAAHSGVTGSSTTILAPGVTTGVDDSMLVGLFAASSLGPISPVAMTDRGGLAQKIKYALSMRAGEVEAPTAGATGDQSATLPQAANNIGQLIALNPTGLTP